MTTFLYSIKNFWLGSEFYIESDYLGFHLEDFWSLESRNKFGS